jgi:hypothetical protein
MLRCGVRHVHDLFDRGELEGFRDGRNKRFFERSVLDYIARNTNSRVVKPAATRAPDRNHGRRASACPVHPKMGSVALEFLNRVSDGR